MFVMIERWPWGCVVIPSTQGANSFTSNMDRFFALHYWSESCKLIIKSIQDRSLYCRLKKIMRNGNTRPFWADLWNISWTKYFCFDFVALTGLRTLKFTHLWSTSSGLRLLPQHWELENTEGLKSKEVKHCKHVYKEVIILFITFIERLRKPLKRTQLT